MSDDRGTAAPYAFPIMWASFGSIWMSIRHLPTYVRASWLPMLLFLLGTVALTYVHFFFFAGVSDFETNPEAAMAGVMISSIASFLGLALYLLLAPVATASIRLTVFGPPEDGRFPLWRFGAEEWAYIGYFILLSVIGFGLIMGLTILGALGALMSPLLLFVILPVGYFFMLYVSARLFPVLANAALGEQASIGEAWRLTRSHGASVTVALFILSVILVLVQLLLMTLFGGLGVVLNVLLGVVPSNIFSDVGAGMSEQEIMEAFSGVALIFTVFTSALFTFSVLVMAIFFGRLNIALNQEFGRLSVDAFD